MAETVVIDKHRVHYKQGPNGLQSDYHADYLETYGPCEIPDHVGLGSGMKDRRDNRDPAVVGQQTLLRLSDQREIERRILENVDSNGEWRLIAVTEEDAALLTRAVGRPFSPGDYIEGGVTVSDS